MTSNTDRSQDDHTCYKLLQEAPLGGRTAHETEERESCSLRKVMDSSSWDGTRAAPASDKWYHMQSRSTVALAWHGIQVNSRQVIPWRWRWRLT